MNNFTRTLLAIALIFTFPFTSLAQKPGVTKYKCMVQMTNYVGEDAYVVVSLINPKGLYEKTLYVMGPDKKWYTHIKEWHKFNSKKPANISAITGASVAGGDRSVTTFEIEDSKLNAGYKLRFETAVEDKQYYAKDIEVPLTTEGVSSKTEGTNYIRYVRFSQN
ncbi:DUF2271 domain-containing protein [Pedobacter frigiditerrae]|uniref:DUF2271 domain-containing protein n=1 Tax=Pedobacter frigiditerrae TaxID=2530452 RepID=A0A4R0MTC6_9SPHI|nr:DUF2271 domain-containing protein [Pedobacter frigiditerrae]TCC90319.1 DUF2271 domain-containing protein [Pedobacter frigiditerrae]